MSRLSVTCPRCETTYQVDPDLKGRRMRCPNVLCQTIFQVGEDAPAQPDEQPPAPAEKPPKSTAGTVGDIVPILHAEIASGDTAEPSPDTSQPLRPEPSPSAPRVGSLARSESKSTRPPLRRRNKPAELLDEFKDLTFDASVPESDVPAQPLTQTDWQAPPVRRRGTSEPVAPLASQPVADATSVSSEPGTHKEKRRSRWIIALLAVLLLAGAGITAWMVLNKQSDIEADLFSRAENWFQNGDFAEAAALYRRLLHDYPSSDKRATYQFHAELSSVLDAVTTAQANVDETVKTLDRFGQFVRFQQGGPLFTRHQEELWRAARTLTLRLVDHADQEKNTQFFELANGAWQTARALRDPGHVDSPKDKELITDRLARLKDFFADQQHRDQVVAQLRQLPPSAKSVQAARALVVREKLDREPQITGLIAELQQKHQASIIYTPIVETASPAQNLADEPTTIAFASAVPVPAALQASGLRDDASAPQIVLALARGVLHGVDSRTGQVRWLRKIGADAVQLPLRLSATPIAPELAVFIGGDQNVICAIDLATGADVWRQRLDSPCLAQPLLVGKRLFLPTTSGRIVELDSFSGRALGYYQTDQRLALTPVHQQGGNLIYCAGDEICVYVLDIAERKCTAILYSGHGAGALTSTPVIVNPYIGQKVAGKGFLILSQINGINSSVLRAFPIPVADAQQAAVDPEIKLPGRCWLPPLTNAETLAQVTDAGVFTVYGASRSNSPAFFPLFQQQISSSSASAHGERAALVDVDAENYWVLSQGHMQRLQRRFLPKTGPALAERWPDSLYLGNPLHAAQVLKDGVGHATFILTTQPENSSHALLTAVAAESGRIHWQRRLGLVVDADTVLIGKRVLLQEADGVTLLDVPVASSGPLVIDETSQRIPLSSSGKGGIIKTPTDDKYAVHGVAKALTIYKIDKEGQFQPANKIGLSAAISGMPALADGYLVAALANGVLERAALSGEERIPGPNWRSSNADGDSQARLIALPGDEFVVSDGDRGLRLLHWPNPKSFDKKAEIELPTAITALVALAVGERANRIVTAEASGVISLLDASTLQVLRKWQMPGRISSGPFARGQELGCIVEGNRLVWLDSNKDGHAWEYTFDADIVGQPQVIDDLVIVGTVAGQIQAFDKKMVRLQSDGFLLRTSVAPAATPLPIGGGRLFTALSDGTALMLPLSALE